MSNPTPTFFDLTGHSPATYTTDPKQPGWEDWIKEVRERDPDAQDEDESSD